MQQSNALHSDGENLLLCSIVADMCMNENLKFAVKQLFIYSLLNTVKPC
jgi:hypothetical protein